MTSSRSNKARPMATRTERRRAALERRRQFSRRGVTANVAARRRRTRLRWGIAGGVVVLLAAGTAVFFATRDDGDGVPNLTLSGEEVDADGALGVTAPLDAYTVDYEVTSYTTDPTNPSPGSQQVRVTRPFSSEITITEGEGDAATTATYRSVLGRSESAQSGADPVGYVIGARAGALRLALRRLARRPRRQRRLPTARAAASRRTRLPGVPHRFGGGVADDHGRHRHGLRRRVHRRIRAGARRGRLPIRSPRPPSPRHHGHGGGRRRHRRVHRAGRHDHDAHRDRRRDRAGRRLLGAVHRARGLRADRPLRVQRARRGGDRDTDRHDRPYGHDDRRPHARTDRQLLSTSTRRARTS